MRTPLVLAIMFVCGAAAPLASCGDDANSTPVTRGVACDALVGALCARLTACDPDLGPSDEQDCNNAFGPMCCNAAQCDEPSIESGAVAACDQALESFACGGLASQRLPDECANTPVDDVY